MLEFCFSVIGYCGLCLPFCCITDYLRSLVFVYGRPIITGFRVLIVYSMPQMEYQYVPWHFSSACDNRRRDPSYESWSWMYALRLLSQEELKRGVNIVSGNYVNTLTWSEYSSPTYKHANTAYLSTMVHDTIFITWSKVIHCSHWSSHWIPFLILILYVWAQDFWI